MSTLSVSNITNLSNLSLSTLTAATINAATILQNGLPVGGSPVGTVVDLPWSTANSVPSGFLRLDGNNYTRSAFPELASRIGQPEKIGNYTVLFQNTSLLLSDVHNANGVLFHNGTTPANTFNTFTANSIVYSRDGGTTWISAPALGLSTVGYGTISTTSSHGGALTTASRVAANGTGTYVITNGGVNNNIFLNNSNAFVMYATSENLNTWTKFVFTGPAQLTPLSFSQYALSTGTTISSVAYGGTQNRFVALLQGVATSYSCCGSQTGYVNSRIFYSNNGTDVWTSVSLTTSPSGVANVGSAFNANDGRNAFGWIDVVASANGFVATKFMFSGGVGYITATANSVITSADGIVWTDLSPTVGAASLGYNNSSFERIPSFANGLFIIAASTPSYITTNTLAILTSTDRTNWTRVPVNIVTGGVGPFTGRKIYHNGSIYYSSTANGNFSYSSDLTNWFGFDANIGDVNIIASANVGNTIYGHAAANLNFSGTQRMSIGSTTHNTYLKSTQFPLPNVSANTVIFTNPYVAGTKFIKT